MAVGSELTKIVVLLLQPVVGSVGVITTVPASTPVTIPDVKPTMALPLLALHVQPGVAVVKVILSPTQTALGPEIGAGSGLTVKTAVLRHPVGSV